MRDAARPSRPAAGKRFAWPSLTPHRNTPARALQAWIILVGAAMNRQSLTYEGLSVKMYQRKAAGVLDKILVHIAHYCIQEGLPPLTSIVVRKRRGTPGEDIPLNAADLDIAREKVYSYDWYDEIATVPR